MNIISITKFHSPITPNPLQKSFLPNFFPYPYSNKIRIQNKTHKKQKNKIKKYETHRLIHKITAHLNQLTYY